METSPQLTSYNYPFCYVIIRLFAVYCYQRILFTLSTDILYSRSYLVTFAWPANHLAKPCGIAKQATFLVQPKLIFRLFSIKSLKIRLAPLEVMPPLRARRPCLVTRSYIPSELYKTISKDYLFLFGCCLLHIFQFSFSIIIRGTIGRVNTSGKSLSPIL